MGLGRMSVTGFQGSACMSETKDGGEPRVGPATFHVRFEHRRADRLDPPPVVERAADLTLRHAPRPPFPGFPLTEAHHVIRATFPKYRRQASNEGRAFLVRKHVEEAGVDHRVERRSELAQAERVVDEELCTEATFSSLSLRLRDCPCCAVDAPHLVPASGEQQSVFARAATDIKDATSDHPTVREAHELGLWSSDVPWRRALIGGVEEAHLHHRP